MNVERTLAAFQESWASLRAWLGDLPAQAFARTSVLDGWTVEDLAAHVGLAVGVLEHAKLAQPGRPTVSVGTYVGSYPDAAGPIAAGARRQARADAGQVLTSLDATYGRAVGQVAVLAGNGGGDPVLDLRRGHILLSDLLLTRLVEVVVHGDDLARSLPEVSPPDVPREGLRLVVRAMLDALLERAPGHSVEVRVPPFAAVQCLEGPRHTRGTPPNVVEADPLTWIRLACGRVRWDEAVAVGAVRASGERADLSPYLPLL